MNSMDKEDCILLYCDILTGVYKSIYALCDDYFYGDEYDYIIEFCRKYSI